MVISVVAFWGVGLGGGWALAFDPWQSFAPALHGARGYWIASTAGLAVAGAALTALLIWVMRRKFSR